jgi:diguanylate cyclase (GGDEF)-like protein/PAS domain S-box-containing protein
VRALLARNSPQPMLGTLTMLAALGLCAATWLLIPLPVALDHGDVATVLLGLVLLATYVLTNHYPIHVSADMQVCVGSVPALLIAALLPVPQAAIVFLLGKGIGELTVRADRGGYYSDVASQVGRWVIVGILASIVAHLPSSAGSEYRVPLIGAVAVMWLGDILTSPLVLYPISGDRPWRIIRAVAREAGAAEGAQYLLGILGVLAAQGARWSVLLLAFPTALVYLAFKSAKDVRETSRTLLASVVETSPDAIFVLDVDRRIVAANQQAAALFGHGNSSELRGSDILAMMSREDRDRAREDLDRVLDTGPIPESEFLCQRRDASTFFAEMVAAPTIDRRGRVKAITCVMRDITRRKQAARELEQRALHDPLTAIPNRVLFGDRLRQAIMRAERDGIQFAVLVLDLNNFKAANDTYGHLCGDFVLQEVARRLVRVLRESDTVARLGGDEFAILLPKSEAAGAGIVSGRIQTAMAEVFDFEDQTLPIGTSIGIALYGPDGRDPDTLLRQADAAMYMSKRAGTPWVFAGAQRGIYRDPLVIAS